MKFFVISQNLTKSDIKLPKHAILRVNLAWHKDLESVLTMLSEYPNHDIFLDIPVGRKKPPNHDHSLDDVEHLVNVSRNIKYVAISNIEDPNNLAVYCRQFKANIVPKIETLKGAVNLPDIIDELPYALKVIMLDHEDLYSNLVNHRKEKSYLEIVDKIVRTCKKKNAVLLRAKGIIFTND